VASPTIIWSNFGLHDELREHLAREVAKTGAHRLRWGQPNKAGNLPPGVPDPTLEGADFAFGQPHGPQVAELPQLRWVHLSSAGFSSFDVPAVMQALGGRGTRLTTSSSVYAEPCAQHVLAFLLAHTRLLPDAWANQHPPSGAPGWPKRDFRSRAGLLRGQTVLLVGMGTIAHRLCELLAPFGLELIGVRRRPRGDEPVPTIATSALDQHLPRADVVIDLLPGNAETGRFFDAGRFGRMKPGALFINIGRGTTVEQSALCAALTGGLLGGACLDVTDPEPLPPDHELWSAPRCVITPHAAGGHSDEQARLVAHFLDNLGRIDRGQEPRDRVL
jgi:phosphoglycerate dehydrogenase-like enzyme